MIIVEKFSFDWYSYGKISALASLYNLVICLVNSKKELIYFGDKKVDARFIYMINDDSKNSFQGLMAVKRDDPKEIIKEFTGYNMAKDLLDDFIRNDLQCNHLLKENKKLQFIILLQILILSRIYIRISLLRIHWYLL